MQLLKSTERIVILSDFLPRIFISKDVGKHFNMSKKKVQWGLFYDGGV